MKIDRQYQALRAMEFEFSDPEAIQGDLNYTHVESLVLRLGKAVFKPLGLLVHARYAPPSFRPHDLPSALPY